MEAVGTQKIETERLILRKLEMNDVELIHTNWTSDYLVTRYLSWSLHKDRETTEKYVQSVIERYTDPLFFDWVVILKENNEPIGEISAVKVSPEHNLVEMGDCYGSKYWNRGYGTEALKAFINYMFKQAKVDKIIACHISTNPASGRIMVKAGMHYDATLVGYFIDKTTGLRQDKICYSIDSNSYI